ncbi:Colicin V production protein [Croceitalea dokdonensis DOKDO 023]|uniref:Colicin V production protein n=1 Tax=Croceitalea dokdonensis DOKDO 023 TaxID=1300341 RepID=A0A0P7AM67_9FLAO|nr:CvpA family protein [Croceitalea dokdonensis]KPM33011.1 Colicin V production protein [Croceitalea dokdonensis DOKDO 023]
MSFIDIVLGILLALGLYKGLKNGLFVELASLVALIAGIYGAIHFSYIAGDYMAAQMDWDQKYIKITAFLITFVAIILLVHFAGKLLTKIADFAMLGILNKIAGGIFGTLKVAIILGALLLFFEKATASFDFVSKDTQEASIFYTPVRDIGAFVFSLVFKDAPENLLDPENQTQADPL